MSLDSEHLFFSSACTICPVCLPIVNKSDFDLCSLFAATLKSLESNLMHNRSLLSHTKLIKLSLCHAKYAFDSTSQAQRRKQWPISASI